MTRPTPSKAQPLADIRVLDASRIFAGPYCGQMLADLGAEVIKLEPPTGDDTRRFGPPFVDGCSTYFMALNRGKKSIALDLMTPGGRQIAQRLIAWADVILENFRPGTHTKLGFAPEQVRAHRPNAIHITISAFGQAGIAEYAQKPGYDLVMQGMGGLASITGPVDGAPHKVGVAIADLIAGQNALAACLAALHLREKTGEGQHIDIALFDGQLAAQGQHATAWLNAEHRPERHGNAHPNICPYETLEAKDGHLNIACANDGQFQRLCDCLDVQSLSGDTRFATNPVRVENRAALIPQLERKLRQHSVAHWIATLDAARIPCGPILTVPEALGHPQVAARNMIVQHPNGWRTVGPPLGLPLVANEQPPPALNADGESLMRQLFGDTWREQDGLVDAMKVA